MVTPEINEEVRRCLRVILVALCVRIVGAWMLGEGAPFGPDGTGAEAAVHLGGHPYPLHIVGLQAIGGDARALSMLCGSLNCGLLWFWGRRVGLGGAGGWLAASFPLAVLPGVLAAGDAPALTLVLLGAVLSTFGGASSVLGGVIAAASVAVKPIALPAMVLLLANPISLVGTGGGLLLFRAYIRPLWAPMPDGGLLGSWWVSTEGALPELWVAWLSEGLWQLVDAQSWSLCSLFFLACLASLLGVREPKLRIAGIATLGAAVAVAALFGNRLELRYLSAVFVAALPFVGLMLQQDRWVALVTIMGLWPSAAVLSQLGAERAALDPQALVPDLPVIGIPVVEVRPIFDSCSTKGATRLRNLAYQLAEVAPPGSTIVTDALPDGREGELIWPLRVMRPDLKVSVR
jgi:hypothetical protein